MTCPRCIASFRKGKCNHTHKSKHPRLNKESEVKSLEAENEQLKSWVKHHQECVEIAMADRKKTEAQNAELKNKLEVAVEGLRDISKECLFYARDRANKALATIEAKSAE